MNTYLAVQIPRTHDRQLELQDWLSALDMRKLVVVELGAGTYVPTVRMFGEQLVDSGATLVRINPREFNGPAPGRMRGSFISIPAGSLEALQLVHEELEHH